VRIDRAVSIADLREIARRRLPKAVFDFIEGAAESETTSRRNCTDFEKIEFIPRALVDVAARNMSVPILARQAALPVAISPTGLATVAWADAEVALARVAYANNIPFTLSIAASTRLERIRAAVPDARLWFQLYGFKDRELVRSLIRRVHSANYEALVLTVDIPVVGQRNRDLHNGFTIPLRPTLRLIWDLFRCPRWTAHILTRGAPTMQNLIDGLDKDSGIESIARLLTRNMDASLNWSRLVWIRDLWPGKIVIKGILSPLDAERAVQLGFDAIAVSNHGGRQLDFAVSAIAALPDIVAAVGDRADIYLDGGVRRGSDIVKAMALGARAVMVGRATLFGAAAGGENGARRCLSILTDELDRCLALLGCADVRDLNPSFLRGAAIDERHLSEKASKDRSLAHASYK